MRFTRPPEDPAASAPRPTAPQSPKSRTWGRPRTEAVLEALESAKTWLAVLLPVYLVLRVFSFAGANPSLTLEVIRQQGISGIAEAAVTSLMNDLSGLVFVSGALMTWVTWSGERPKGGPVESDSSWAAIRVAAPLVTVAAFVVTPLTFVALSVLLAGLILFSANTKLIYGLLVVLGAVALARPVTSAAWLPYERIAGPGLVSTDGEDKELPYVYGYVIGEKSSGDFYSVLEDEPRRAHLVLDITARQICEPPKGWWWLDSPSVLDRALSGVEVRACKDLPDNVEAPLPPSPTPDLSTPVPGGTNGSPGATESPATPPSSPTDSPATTRTPRPTASPTRRPTSSPTRTSTGTPPVPAPPTAPQPGRGAVSTCRSTPAR